ncbi:cysteine proteinase [Schizopora paradoxa]|uniref:Ubiquitin carboxyl-terminal hydrolase n=1 Tax=Schizopora paradoxa TaxID=27342 RepID=A0A0H2S6V7_9AGAM|nr:cysteine proteinase [Schizopora paradoxa]
MTTLMTAPPSPSLLFNKSSSVHSPTSPTFALNGHGKQEHAKSQPPPQLFSTATTHEHTSVRPAKNMEAFNSLLPPEVEFVEGSSTGTLALSSMEGRYEPINASPRASLERSEVNGTVAVNGTAQPRLVPQTPAPSPKRKRANSPERTRSLYSKPIIVTWPPNVSVGSGYYNTGNTCFLNSALQCLLHTPPLLHVLIDHLRGTCQLRSRQAFCMICSLGQVATETYKNPRAFSPYHITKNLHQFAKHLRKGRQEDSHEFLRYAIDALQKSALTMAGHTQKVEPRLAETTWVHKIFGGGLRSRVSCTQCGYNSDTFDSILDLSIDIDNVNHVKAALKKFTAIDYLKGADKYKCEKCKRPVNAEKSFSVHKAPVVLTIHLKRFTPLGRKLGHMVAYDERLSLESVMSKGQYGPKYSLFGVISHAGGGPNSGHYYAHVKAANGNWYEMNDESVERVSQAPLNMKSAYILFYVQLPGQALETTIKSNGVDVSVQRPNGIHSQDLSNGSVSKKRKASETDDEREDAREKASKPFIGPMLPSSVQTSEKKSKPVVNGHTPSSSTVDPNAESLKKKIEAHTQKAAQHSSPPTKSAAPTPKSLVNYSDDEDDDDEDTGEAVKRASTPTATRKVGEDKTANVSRMDIDSSPNDPPPSSPPVSSPVAATSFYGKSESATMKKSLSSSTREKTKSIDSFSESRPVTPVHKPSMNGSNPFGRSRVGNSIDESYRSRKPQKITYGKKKKLLF